MQLGFLGRIFKPKTTKEIIIDKFYKGYPELPYISNERNRENMEYKEGKRKLESSSRTDAQKAAEEYNPK